MVIISMIRSLIKNTLNFQLWIITDIEATTSRASKDYLRYQTNVLMYFQKMSTTQKADQTNRQLLMGKRMQSRTSQIIKVSQSSLLRGVIRTIRRKNRRLVQKPIHMTILPIIHGDKPRYNLKVLRMNSLNQQAKTSSLKMRIKLDRRL